MVGGTVWQERAASLRGRHQAHRRAAAPVGNFPVLMKMNYYDWAVLMHVMLQARGLWTTVSEGAPDYTEDRMALEVIAKAVPPEMLGSIASKLSAKVV
jgi:hypothetical protein